MPTRILIADDNPAVRTALRRLLEGDQQWEVTDVENGQQAVAKAQELKPNIIILDLVMPVMDGLVAARKLSKALPDIPLLMYTMHWSPQVQLEAQKVGARKVVSKTDSKGLVAAIQELLSGEALTSPSPVPTNLAESAPLPSIAATAIESADGTGASKADSPAAAESGSTPDNQAPN
jgi:two-component system, NarL family, response regulator NreC